MQIPATIVEITQKTPTTKALRLDLGGQPLPFLPGQWVDCYADVGVGVEVAGYSMTSSPLTTDAIELAVKLVGENPVTHYVHKRARTGDVLYVEVGGGFYYKREMGDSLVLIAGGIGVTPLMSIARYVHEAAPGVRLTLLYSAKSPSELLFRDDFDAISRENENVRCLYTVTRPEGEAWGGRVGRIDAAMIAEADIDSASFFFICGPPPMIVDTVALVEGLGVPASRIKYEGW